jgi:primosomal protein N' (replication factor Y)
MAAEWAEVRGAPLLSRVLAGELKRALERGERALLFQNRRGFTTFLQCPSCGAVQKCRQCDIALTYHRAQGTLLCHFCDLRASPPGGPCPACLGPPLRQRGAGTERIEELVRERYPGVAVGRLDTDVVREGEDVAAVLDRFRRGEVQVLIGTQMIAKGLDVPELTVVGVISADTSLGLPDFRASERTYQLVAQVAGRAGRGARPGTTVIQTFLPAHFALVAAAGHAYETFAREELESRRALGYPPWTRLLKVLWRGPAEDPVRAEAEAAVEALRAACQGDPEVLGVLGPAPSPRAFLAGKLRWQALIKGTVRGVRTALAALRARKAPAGVEVVLDVDPYHLL